MRAAMVMMGTALVAAGGAQAGGYGGRSQAVAGASATAHSHAFATASAGGRSDFRSGGFARYGASNGNWGFGHGAGVQPGYGARYQGYASPGSYGGRSNHGGRFGRGVGYGVAAGLGYGLYAGGYGYPYGYDGTYGYDSAPAYDYADAGYGAQAPYGDSAGEMGYAPQTPPYAPALAQGPYGAPTGYGETGGYPDVSSAGQVYTSGEGAYAYSYQGYASTPAMGYAQTYGYAAPACGC